MTIGIPDVGIFNYNLPQDDLFSVYGQEQFQICGLQLDFKKLKQT